MPTQLTTGDLVTAANWNTIPGGQLGYAQITTNLGSITTSPLTIATVTPAIPANRRIKLTGGWQSWTTTNANDRIRFDLFALSVRMEQIEKGPDINFARGGGTIIGTFSSGAGGSIACTFRAVRHSGSGTLTVLATTSAPAFILVEDMGAV